VASAKLVADAILAGRPGAYATALAAPARRVDRIVETLVARITGRLPESILRLAARQACTRPRLRRRLVLEGAFGIG
ncbi:MAG TPA: hypothetical protein VKA21_14315, partial [Candidatus Binatia bacterium]|nr:hypothetical protein [Candidatus Binatia bacterium]